MGSRSRSRWGLVDLFSGCGGTSAGFLATAAYEHLYAADNDRWANATYERNLGFRPEALDLSTLLAPATRQAWARQVRGQHRGPVVLVGGPPCQGFSSHVKVAGDRRGRNSLFQVFALAAVELAPDVVMIENVPDLVSDRSWHVFREARDLLTEAGYEVRARILNMADLGVPQERFRIVMLAAKGTVRFPARVRTPETFSTVKDWIGDLPPVASGETDPFDPMHQASRHRPSTLDIILAVPVDGGTRPADVGPECLRRARAAHGGYTDVYGRLAWSKPAPTITARCRTPSCGRFVHPEQDRGLTAREAGLLQTFSRDWQFEGPFDDRYKQIGNAVPPLAALAFAEHIAAGMPEHNYEVGVLEVGDIPVGSSFSVLIPGIRKRSRLS